MSEVFEPTPFTSEPLPADIAVEDALGAWWAVTDIWSALGLDDDEATAELMLEHDQGESIEPGYADRVRRDLGVTLRECRGMAVSTTLTVLADGQWAYTSIVTGGVPARFDTPTIGFVYVWIAGREPGGPWRVARGAGPKEIDAAVHHYNVPIPPHPEHPDAPSGGRSRLAQLGDLVDQWVAKEITDADYWGRRRALGFKDPN